MSCSDSQQQQPNRLPPMFVRDQRDSDGLHATLRDGLQKLLRLRGPLVRLHLVHLHGRDAQRRRHPQVRRGEAPLARSRNPEHHSQVSPLQT